MQVNLKPTEERDLVPDRPYLFNLGNSSSRHPEYFRILSTVAPIQYNTLKPGYYGFQVTVFSENASRADKWYLVKWHGSPTEEALAVSEENDPPW